MATSAIRTPMPANSVPPDSSASASAPKADTLDAQKSMRPRTVLICHHDAALDRTCLAGWLNSFTDLTGIVEIRETSDQVKRRVRREYDRVGPLRFLDVLAFRAWYKLNAAAADRAWTDTEVARLSARYPLPTSIPILTTDKPNGPEVEAFVRNAAPDLVVARSKFMLNKRIYGIPPAGTMVLHPGICPEYRNAHGCFWALAQGDITRVGLTLLAIDDGIDTGPMYGTYTYSFDEVGETHHRIQLRCLTENLDPIATKLLAIYHGKAIPLDTTDHHSAVWGQPWLSKHLSWKRAARLRARAAIPAALKGQTS